MLVPSGTLQSCLVLVCSTQPVRLGSPSAEDPPAVCPPRAAPAPLWQHRSCPRPEPRRSQADGPWQRGGRVEPENVSCRSKSSLRVPQGVAGSRLPTHCDTGSHRRGASAPGARARPTPAPGGLAPRGFPSLSLAPCSDLNGCAVPGAGGAGAASQRVPSSSGHLARRGGRRDGDAPNPAPEMWVNQWGVPVSPGMELRRVGWGQKGVFRG